MHRKNPLAGFVAPFFTHLGKAVGITGSGIFFALLCSLPLWAEEKIEVDYHHKIGLNDSLEVTVSYGSDKNEPQILSKDMVVTPSRSTSKNISIVGGKFSMSSIATFVLEPRKVGRASFDVVAGDKTQTYYVDVVSGSVLSKSGGTTRNQSVFDPFSTTFPQISKEDFKLVHRLDRGRRYYQYQPIPVSTYLLIPQGVSVNDYQWKNRPTSDDSLLIPSEGKPVILSSSGKEVRILIQRAVDIPLKNKISLSGGELFVVFAPRGDFFLDDNTLVKGNDEQIEVRSLPPFTGKIPFSHVVAEKLEAVAALSSKMAQKHDTLVLSVTFKATGNLRLLEAPLLDSPDFEVRSALQPPVERIDEKGLISQRLIEYYLTPKVAGNLNVPSIGITYFDTAEERYLTVKTPPLSLSVSPGDTSKSDSNTASTQKIPPSTSIENHDNGSSVPPEIHSKPFAFYSLFKWTKMLLQVLCTLALFTLVLGFIGDRRQKKKASKKKWFYNALEQIPPPTKRDDLKALYDAVVPFLYDKAQSQKIAYQDSDELLQILADKQPSKREDWAKLQTLLKTMGRLLFRQVPSENLPNGNSPTDLRQIHSDLIALVRRLEES